MPFFMTQGLGAFNDNIFKNALAAMLVFEGSQMAGLNTDQVVNLSAMVFILPFFLFSALFGQFADKYEKSMQIRSIKLFEVVIMLLATLGFWLDSCPCCCCAVPARAAVHHFRADQVRHPAADSGTRELVGGNALIEMGTFVAILAGTIAGPNWLESRSSWPYWVSRPAWRSPSPATCSAADPDAEAVAPDLKINWNIFSETVRNLKFINENQVVLNSVLGISWFWFFGATFLVQIPSYSQNVLGGDENLMSTLLALFIIGISTGSLLCERLSGKQVEIGLVPFGAIGLTLFGLDLYFASPAVPTLDHGLRVSFRRRQLAHHDRPAADRHLRRLLHRPALCPGAARSAPATAPGSSPASISSMPCSW